MLLGWHRALQWRLEEANLEIFILQGSSYSLCKALVQSPSVFMSGSIFGLLGEPLLLIGEQQKPRKIVILGIKTRKIFWPAGAGLSPLRRLKAGEAKFSL